MTQGLARVEELFETRFPKNPAVISDLDGVIEVQTLEKNLLVRVTAHELEENQYYFSGEYVVMVKP